MTWLMAEYVNNSFLYDLPTDWYADWIPVSLLNCDKQVTLGSIDTVYCN